MAASINLRVKWSPQTARLFGPQSFNIPWNETQLVKIDCREPPMTMQDIGTWIETRVLMLYYQMTYGQDTGQAQVVSIQKLGSQNSLPLDEHAAQYLKDGDAIVVECQLSTLWWPQIIDRDLDQVRANLRFALNDRVVCNCGPRWFSGHVVGTAVVDDDEILPYLVKTDPLPGVPGRTISVPEDDDEICVQDVCFDPKTQLHLVMTAAQDVPESSRPQLRFAIGDAVVVRVRNSAEDGLEQWLPGKVGATWPKFERRPKRWNIAGVTGEFPDTVPYKVDLRDGRWLYCHRDHFTLIRREGMQPHTRVKGASKRMEVIKAEDGSIEQVDHQTERRKVMKNIEDSDSD